MSLYVRIRTRFGYRIAEWAIAVQTALFGLVLLLPTSTYDTSTVFGFIRRLLPEEVLGGVMLFFGALRLIGLLINGARQDITPWIRVVSASVGVLVFLLLSFSFALSGVLSTWIAIYPIIAMVEILNVYRASHDAGEYRAGMA